MFWKKQKNDEEFPPDLIKHLEMIQVVVGRLASNSFLVKGWTLTLSAALYGFAVNRGDWRLAAIGSGVVVMFWFLDSYYLTQERMYRCLYEDVRNSENSIPRFSLNARKYRDKIAQMKAFFSISLVPFYLIIFTIGIMLGLFILLDSDPPSKALAD